MKIKNFFINTIAVFSFGLAYTQQSLEVGTYAYEQAKLDGTISGYSITTPNMPEIRPVITPLTQYRTPTQCFSYTDPNATATSQSLSDDGSTGTINFPFNFCMYGQTFTSCNVNANGNVTFNGARTTFSSVGFPSNSNNPMLAPFWADIDMRGIGSAYYEVLPNAVIVHWENCGYFSQQTDKTVTLQLIFTDGTSSLLPPGNNVGFFYENMDWTTGSASGGTNGFGGTPMTVGVDNGDGTNGFQLGRFDEPGSSYDGPFGNEDGIDWLDDQTFIFNLCTPPGSTTPNIAPIINGVQVCDTLRICLGDSLPINFDVLAVEQDQVSGAFIDTTGVQGFNLISYVPGVAGNNGNSASLSSYFRSTVVDTFTLGLNYFDDGLPSDTLEIDLVIIVDTLPYNPILSGDTSICLGTQINIGAGNFFDSYLWTDSLSNTVGMDSSANLDIGWNYLEVSINGCIDNDSINILGFPDHTPVFSGDIAICEIDSTLITIQDWPIIDWDTLGQPNSNISQNDSVYFRVGGNYTATIVDTSGCTFMDTIEIFDLQSFVQIVGPTEYCERDSALLIANTGGNAFEWENSTETNDSIYVFAGTYSIRVTRPPGPGYAGCVAQDTIVVQEIAVPIPSITGPTTVCPGELVKLGFTPQTYDSHVWLNGLQLTDSISVGAGDYKVAINVQGCLDTSSTFIVQGLPDNTPVFNGETTVCGTDSSLISIDNTHPFINWVNNLNNNIESTVQTANISSGSYTVNIEDVNGCSFSSSIQITSLTELVQIQGGIDYCPGNSSLLYSMQGFDSYSWDNGISVNDSIWVTAGEHVLEVVGLNGSCTANDTIIVNEIVIPVPVIQGSTVACPNEQVSLSFQNQGYDSFSWLPGNFSTNPLNVFAGDYQLAVVFQGCLDTSSVFSVTNAVVEDMNMTFKNDVCLNDSVLLETPNSYQSYSWSNGESTAGIYVNQTGSFTLEVIDVNGCENDTTINVTLITDGPVLSAQDSKLCIGDLFSITGTLAPGGGNWSYEGPAGLSFSPNTTFINPTISVTEPGLYNIKFTDARCPFVDSVMVEYIQQPFLQIIGDSSSLCKGEELVIKALTSDPLNTVWEPNLEIGDSIIASEEGIYTVTLSNFCGVLTDEFALKVEDCVVPNVITPNGDNQNDVFVTSLADSYSDTHLIIYSRWGRKVYSNKNYDNTWNGVDNGGNKLSEGTYYYVISYDNDTQSEKGFITLMR